MNSQELGRVDSNHQLPAKRSGVQKPQTLVNAERNAAELIRPEAVVGEIRPQMRNVLAIQNDPPTTPARRPRHVTVGALVDLLRYHQARGTSLQPGTFGWGFWSV